jgi:outer membrane lipoprotein-sorting protein
MTGLPEMIGLLYRADWTRLSLSAELRSEADREPLPLPRPSHQGRPCWFHAWPRHRQDDGRYVARGALLVGPGGRWRLECPVPGPGAEGQGAGGEAAEGNDGERGWLWRPPERGGPPPLPFKVDGAYPPVPELLSPSCLLGGYTLEELGPVTVAGRDATAVAATPRRDVLGSRSAERSYDRIEVAVDAELGILLRRIETSGGELVTLTELTDVMMNPPEAADPTRFAPPPGSHRSETPGESRAERLSGPGRAADQAAGGLSALIRHVPRLLGHGAAGEQPEAMPSPDQAPLGPTDGSSPPDEVLDLLYRSGEPRDLGATARRWIDLPAMMAPMLPAGLRAAGRSGFGDLIETITPETAVARTEARLRVSGPGRYRLDFSSRRRRIDFRTIACDGERRWVVYQDQIMVGPPAPLRDDIAFLADSCWLLRRRLSGGAELTYRGRPARQLHVTRVSGDAPIAPGPLITFTTETIVDAPTDAIVDAETGCLLRLISYSGDTLVIWSELDDISTEPAGPDEFRVHIPPGTRIVEETGNPFADAAAVVPGVKGTAARAAVEAVNRTAGAVSAARSFLDDLRGHR